MENQWMFMEETKDVNYKLSMQTAVVLIEYLCIVQHIQV